MEYGWAEQSEEASVDHQPPNLTLWDQEAEPPPAKANARLIAIGLAVFVGALALRLYGASGESIWYDETLATGGLTSMPDIPAYLQDILRFDPSTDPLYFTCLWGWSKVFGVHPMALRALSLIMGAASVVFLYLIARELLPPRLERLAVTAMGALSITNIYYSQEVRMYAMYLLLANISLWGLIKYFKTGGRGALITNIAANILLVWVHLMSSVLLLLEGCLILWRLRKDKVALLKWGLPQALNIILWYFAWARLISAANIHDISPWKTRISWSEAWFHRCWAQLTSGTFWEVGRLGLGIGLATELLVALGLVMLIRQWRRQKRLQPEHALIMMPVLAVFLLFALSMHAFPCWTPRYTLYAQTSILILAVAGTRALGRRLGPAALAALTLLFALHYATIDRPFRPDWSRVNQIVDDGRPVLIAPRYTARSADTLGRPPIGLRLAGFSHRIQPVEEEIRTHGGWFVHAPGDTIPTDLYRTKIESHGFSIGQEIEIDGKPKPFYLFEIQ